MSIGEGLDWLKGEEIAWRRLSELDHRSVCRRAKSCFHKKSGYYILPVFNTEIYVSPTERRIWGDSPVADLLLNELPHLSRLPFLWYLAGAGDIPLSDTLVNPRQLSGGGIFVRGSHMLPLDMVLKRYYRDVNAFILKGTSLGGEPLDYGDASVRLFPFPRVPLVLIMWQDDGEFPASAEVLFDSTCSRHLPTDIIWATAMMTIELFIK